MTDFVKRMSEDAEIINRYLQHFLDKSIYSGRESRGFDVMLDAMKYSLDCGGKRIRPILAIEICRLLGGKEKYVYSVACAMEMIHTYSLIHDDLPCMDDDDFRRGKPSNHIVYGYANALLAGDGLLTLAFETALSNDDIPVEKRCRYALELSKAAGASGMIAGQVMDLENEKCLVDIQTLRLTDTLKTGALIRACGKIACIAADASEKDLINIDNFCSYLGLAFQVIDDILDVISTNESLGKPVGSDKGNKKSTYVSTLGLECSKKYAIELTEKAKNSIINYKNNEFLLQFADYLCNRLN